MPLPLAPLLPLALRLGAVASFGLAVRALVNRHRFPGRTDQRAEDALDDLGEGLSIHRPADRACAETGDQQTNATVRLRRVVRFRGRVYELDAGLIARVRLKETSE